MFDLDQSLAEWRCQMLAAGIQTPVPLEELESHLHEEIAQLVAAGQDEATAFHTAVQNIGAAPALRHEFAKIKATPQGRHWRMFESVFGATALGYPLLVGGLAVWVKNGRIAEMTPSQQLSCLAAEATFSGLAWGMRWNCGRFPVMLTHRSRDAIFLLVLLWLVALAYLIMPRCDLTPGQSGVVSMWGFAPFGILIGWLWGMAAAARKNVATTGS